MTIPKTVYVITEGATERLVGKALYERGILTRTLKPKPAWERDKAPREGYDSVIGDLLFREEAGGFLDALVKKSSKSHVLLLFDQEGVSEPKERAEAIADYFREYGKRNRVQFWQQFAFEALDSCTNVFIHSSDKLKLILHVADVLGPGGNRDFDGYILQLLKGSGREKIAQELVGDSQLAKHLLHKAKKEIPGLMEQNGFPLNCSKSWLYVYIATFQQRTSHAWFAEQVVENASEADLHRVFASLIAAWNALK